MKKKFDSRLMYRAPSMQFHPRVMYGVALQGPTFHAKYERPATATVSMKSPAWALVDMWSALGRPLEIWEVAEGLGEELGVGLGEELGVGLGEELGVGLGEELGVGIGAGPLTGMYISPGS